MVVEGGGVVVREAAQPAPTVEFAVRESGGLTTMPPLRKNSARTLHVDETKTHYSIRQGEGKAAERNLGHPVQPQEVDWFLVMVKKAAPAMTPDEAKVLEDWLRAQKKQ